MLLYSNKKMNKYLTTGWTQPETIARPSGEVVYCDVIGRSELVLS